MRTIAVANSKGGVCKTTTAIHLATGFALGGERTLLVDLDPGGHATTWLLGDKAEAGIAEAIIAGHLGSAHAVELPARPGLMLAPASAGLEGLEAALSKQFGSEMLLGEVLAETSSVFDVVILDCPPSTGFLTKSAIHAATDVLCPVMAGYLGLAGVVDIRGLLEQVRKRSRSRASLLGYLIVAADDREGVTEETRESLDATIRYRSEVRVSTAAKRLPAQRATAWDPGADDRGKEDYAAVLRETRRRLGPLTFRRRAAGKAAG